MEVEESKKVVESNENQSNLNSHHQVKPTEYVANDLVMNETPKEQNQALVNENQSHENNAEKVEENHVNGSSTILNGHCDESSKSSSDLSTDDANLVVQKLLVKNNLPNGDHMEVENPPQTLLPNGEKANGNSHLPNNQPLATSAEN